MDLMPHLLPGLLEQNLHSPGHILMAPRLHVHHRSCRAPARHRRNTSVAGDGSSS